MFGDIYLLFILGACLSSFTLYKHNDLPQYLFAFPVYLTITFLIETWAVWIYYKGGTNTLLYNLFTTFEIVFYIWMFKCIITYKKFKRILSILIFVYPALSVANSFFIQRGGFHSVTAGLGSLVIVICAIFYFYELFNSEKSVNLIRQPEFWISSGLLFFYSCSFPLFSLINNFYSPSNKIIHAIISLLSIVNILLYSSFIIASLCRIRIRKSSS